MPSPPGSPEPDPALRTVRAARRATLDPAETGLSTPVAGRSHAHDMGAMSSRPLFVAWRLAIRAVPAVLLLWAGLSKAFDRQEGILAIDAYQVLPDAMVRIVASLLPWLEIGVGVLLILGLFVRFAGITTAVLASVFIAALVQAKARGLAIDCGCFGGGGTGDGVTWWDIARDIPIVLAGIYLARRPVGPLQLDNLLGVMEDHDDEDRGSNETRTSARTG
jgi:uncharacterized membrane protein YphA (DoxX/SURF4 family)